MILIPIPNYGFDPTEVAVPWSFLANQKEKIVFATPDGYIAKGDNRLLTGKGFGPLKRTLMTDKNVIEIYNKMIVSSEFKNPISYEDINSEEFEAILLPGGHDPGMKIYLESSILQKKVLQFFKSKKIVGAICHGTVIVARTMDNETKKSVLYSYNTTSLLKTQEMGAYYLTFLWLKNYYRTYPVSVQQEVTNALANKRQFHPGKITTKRDSVEHTEYAFVVKDRNYISARWPGDAHLFVKTFYQMLVTWRINTYKA